MGHRLTDAIFSLPKSFQPAPRYPGSRCGDDSRFLGLRPLVRRDCRGRTERNQRALPAPLPWSEEPDQGTPFIGG